MKRFTLASILALLCAGVAAVASAGVNRWTTHGPEGGKIRSLVIDPTNTGTLYAGSWTGSLFKSTNGGASWTAIELGVITGSVNALAIDPSAPATVYAGTEQAGVFKTTDGGNSWSAANGGLTDTQVRSLAIDSASPATIYAGTSEGDVFKSNDGGDSWAGRSLLSPFHSPVNALAIDPAAPSTVYAGTFEGVYKSTDAGVSWTLGSVYDNVEVVALAIDPSAPANVYAGGVFYDWPPSGFLRSTNGGESWTQTGLSGRQVYSVVVDRSAPATLYAGTDSGVFKSTNRGESWAGAGLASYPVVNAGVFALAVDPSASAILYAGTLGGGVYKSGNGGGSWSAVNSGLIASVVSALVIDPSAPANLYSGTSGGGLFKSSDGGRSWRPVHAGLATPFVGALAIDPSAPATLYAGTRFPGGVFKSTDGGESWKPINEGLGRPFIVNALAVDPTAPATLYAAVGFEVFKSVDGGIRWTAFSSGLPQYSVNTLVIDPSMPTTIYAGTDCCVFKSTDGGTHWTESLRRNSVDALAIDPSAPDTIYAGTESGLFKSIDRGTSWVQSPLGRGAASVAIDPANPAIVYAGTRDGVFQSTNAGASWTAIDAGLANTAVSALAIDLLTPTKIYAGSIGRGVFDYEDATCAPGPTTLCLSGGRFQVKTEWASSDGRDGAGQAVALTGGDTGYFTFFGSDNVEVAVKVLNGCSANGSFWIFAGGLTNVGVVMTVTDIQTGTVKSYTNSQGTPFRPIQDTTTFATCSTGTPAGARPYSGSSAAALLPPKVTASVDAGATGPCVASATTLCLNNSRYDVRARWSTADGNSGAGQVIHLTGDTGAFWFFSPTNLEVVVKVLNGCGVNSRYWTFAGGLTDVNVVLTVTDTQTGTVQTYTNPQGIPYEPIQDTNAFAACL